MDHPSACVLPNWSKRAGSMRLRRGLLIAALIALAPPTAVWGHGGGLDSYGCHHNRKLGGYHCHRGPFAGQAFVSQDEMLQQLGQRETPRSAEPQDPARRSAPATPDGVCVEEKGTGRIVCGRVVK